MDPAAAIAIDNINIGGIINSIIHPPPFQSASSLSSLPPTPALAAPSCPSTSSSSTQYLLPIDLLVAVDERTKHSTVRAALPSSFAMNPLSRIPPLQPHQYAAAPFALTGLTSIPQALPSSQMVGPFPSPSHSVGRPKSHLNPSAASFTPHTPRTPIGPIIEHKEIDDFAIADSKYPEYSGPDVPGRTPWLELDPEISSEDWSALDEGQRALPATDLLLSPSFPNQTVDSHRCSFRRRDSLKPSMSPDPDHRDYHKNWRSSAPLNPPKAPYPPRRVSPPRWRANGLRKARGVHSRATKKNQTGSVPKERRILVEFVKHLTLGNRREFPPNTLLTKSWVMRNVGLVEWGNSVQLVFCKGDRALTLYDRYPVINGQPGEEVELSVSLRTGPNPGRMCAYFRMQRDGKFFGPRVWADVIVTAPQGADFNDNAVNCRTDGTLLGGAKLLRKKTVSCK